MMVITWTVKFKTKVDPAIWSEGINSSFAQNTNFSAEDISISPFSKEGERVVLHFEWFVSGQGFQAYWLIKTNRLSGYSSSSATHDTQMVWNGKWGQYCILMTKMMYFFSKEWIPVRGFVLQGKKLKNHDLKKESPEAMDLIWAFLREGYCKNL